MLAEEVGRLLREKGFTVAVAESCTGGKLGDWMTEVPGSSDYFLGGVISYSNGAKIELLGVDEAVLKAKGAVSEEVARQMAAGVRNLFHAQIGVGITGIAGPSGGTPSKPVGLVYIAVSTPTSAVCVENRFKGSRSEIKRQSVEKALSMLREIVSVSS